VATTRKSRRANYRVVEHEYFSQRVLIETASHRLVIQGRVGFAWGPVNIRRSADGFIYEGEPD